ncbi:MAG: DUF4129 domain-containing protein [Pseudomonadota bacterium]
MSGGNTQQAATAAERFAAAHDALKADPSVQFSLTRAPPPPEPPAWLRRLGEWLVEVLRPVGRFLQWISSFMPDAPYARIFLWTVIAVAAAALLWMAYQRIRHGEWRLPHRRRRTSTSVDMPEEAWAPEAAPARAWLNEADALAAQGRYAEAVHHLLFRSIEDIARRRPRLVRPALTSRELAATDAIPPSARDLFAGIARLVEKSLFGGRPVAPEDWETARSAYSDFALPGTWRA